MKIVPSKAVLKDTADSAFFSLALSILEGDRHHAVKLLQSHPHAEELAPLLVVSTVLPVVEADPSGLVKPSGNNGPSQHLDS